VSAQSITVGKTGMSGESIIGIYKRASEQSITIFTEMQDAVLSLNLMLKYVISSYIHV